MYVCMYVCMCVCACVCVYVCVCVCTSSPICLVQVDPDGAADTHCANIVETTEDKNKNVSIASIASIE